MRLFNRFRRRVDAAVQWRAQQAVDPVARRAQDLHDWVARVEANAEWSANQLRRMAPQIAAIEQRLADLHYRLGRDDAIGNDADRTLLDLITVEHERVRAQLSSISLYEERLRRLEDR